MKRRYPLKNKKSLKENLQHTLPLMYDDVMIYKDTVTSQPLAKDMLHQMRITGKPLRYAMETGERAFKADFKNCFNEIKIAVELMGEIHDADIMIPDIETHLKEIRLFNQTIAEFSERLSTKALRNIIEDLRAKRKAMYAELCAKLNNWEKKNFRERLIKAMDENKLNNPLRPATAGLSPFKGGIKDAGTNHPGLQPPLLRKEGTHYNQIITSKLLSVFPNLVHGMSSKIGAINEPPFYNNLSSRVGDNPENVKANRVEFLGKLGIKESSLAVPHQIHSTNIEIVDKPGFYTDRDGLITQTKNVYLVISTADCMPVLVYDKAKEIAAAIHSGWRGTQKNITGTALKILYEKYGSSPDDIIVFIGPGICSKHFEVGEDVAGLFDAEFVEKRGERYYVNILANVLKQLKDSGIKDEQIEFSTYCTFEEKDYLHSYRRDRDKSGRMFSVIGMRDSSDL
jgi:YfiH family protein